MIDEDEKLRNIAKWRTRPNFNKSVSLGDALNNLLENRISPRQARYGPVQELWEQMLPAEMKEHCKLSGVSGGQLNVVVDSPSHANELRWCSDGLLEEIQHHCPRARIQRIKIVTK